jgi:hypothetical protein
MVTCEFEKCKQQKSADFEAGIQIKCIWQVGPGTGVLLEICYFGAKYAASKRSKFSKRLDLKIPSEGVELSRVLHFEFDSPNPAYIIWLSITFDDVMITDLSVISVNLINTQFI